MRHFTHLNAQGTPGGRRRAAGERPACSKVYQNENPQSPEHTSEHHFGHFAGPQVLCAQRLEQIENPEQTIQELAGLLQTLARTSGDPFTVFYPLNSLLSLSLSLLVCMILKKLKVDLPFL